MEPSEPAHCAAVMIDLLHFAAYTEVAEHFGYRSTVGPIATLKDALRVVAAENLADDEPVLIPSRPAMAGKVAQHRAKLAKA